MSLDEQIRAMVREQVAAEVAEQLPGAVAQKINQLVREGRVTVHEDEAYADLDELTGMTPVPAPSQGSHGVDDPVGTQRGDR